MTHLRLVLAILILQSFCSLTTAFKPCAIDRNRIVCNATQYHGRCGTLYRARSENWCTHEGEDICCGYSIADCCADSGAATVGAILLICLLSVCCVSLFCVKRWPFLCSYGARGQNVPVNTAPQAAPRLTPEQRLAAVAEENRALDQLLSLHASDETEVDPEDVKECIVCFERKRDVLLPCGHSQICTPCAEGIARGRRQCPTCRSIFHVFRSVNDPLPSFRDRRDTDPSVPPPARTVTQPDEGSGGTARELDLASTLHDTENNPPSVVGPSMGGSEVESHPSQGPVSVPREGNSSPPSAHGDEEEQAEQDPIPQPATGDRVDEGTQHVAQAESGQAQESGAGEDGQDGAERSASPISAAIS